MYVLDPKERKSFLLYKIATYITRILRIFGRASSDLTELFLTLVVIPDGEIGFPTEEGAVSREKTLAPVLDVLAQFRADVRQAALEKKDYPTFMQLCDKLRNQVRNLLQLVANNVAEPSPARNSPRRLSAVSVEAGECR